MATRNNGIHTIGGETRLDGVHESDVTYIYTHGCRELGALGVFYMRSEHDTGSRERATSIGTAPSRSVCCFAEVDIGF